MLPSNATYKCSNLRQIRATEQSSALRFPAAWLLFFCCVVLFPSLAQAQCPNNEVEVTVTYISDDFNGENAWLLWDATTGTALICNASPATPGTYTACAVVGHQIQLYAWESAGDNWNGGSLAVEYTEDGSNNGGDLLNEVIYGPDGNPGNASGNGTSAPCPSASPTDGSGGALAFSFTAEEPLPIYSYCPWTLKMFDTANDGWSTGERLFIYLDNEPSTTYFLQNGSEGSEQITVKKGGTLDQVFQLGLFNNEVSWELVNDEGVTVFTSQGSPDPNPLATIATTCDDVEPIVFNCPGDVTAQCSDDLSPASQGIATFTGGTGIVTTSNSETTTAGACLHAYTITRTWTATDNLGNETCEQIINVVDDTVPDITCPNGVTVSCDADHTPTNTGGAATATDNCSAALDIVIGSSDALTAGNCPNTFTISRTWTATDECGKIASCDQTIQVEDVTPPIITCPAAITIECSSDNSPASAGYASATDNCSDPGDIAIAFSNAITPGNCPGNYIITRTWTATDECAKASNCAQTITIVDTTPPKIVTCPFNQGPIEWPAGFNTNPVPPNTSQDPSIHESNYNNMVYTELCGSVTITYQDLLVGPTPANCPNPWKVTRTWTITDECGLSSQCFQTFTFKDTTPPTISCPANPAAIQWSATFNTSLVGPNVPQDPSIAPSVFGTATGADHSGPPVISFQDELIGPTPGNCPNIYVVKRTWKAKDLCGLTTTCVQTFTFKDTTPPAITTCPPTRNVDGCTTANITNGDLTSLAFSSTPVSVSATVFMNEGGAASDNCGIQSYTYRDVASGNCPIVVTRTWTVADVCGLSVACTQKFNIDDDTPPVAACQNLSISLNSNGQYNLTTAQIFNAANSSDNCGSVVPVSVVPNQFSCQNEGPNNVVLTVKDGCNNTATCTATVMIADFITNISASATKETCPGTADGTISASATAGGGQIGYSINGGVNFQFSGHFTGLSQGTYTVIIRVFGIPALCQETVSVTVTVGGPTLWYKDTDGDGYTDGTTASNCSQPAGYIANPLAGTDCNDNDAAVNPGAPEQCDGLDNNCNGSPGADETDADGDGFMVCEGDCNDGKATIYPGAPELCDGLDNDCDGTVDDGLQTTYVGNVNFSNQTQLNNWLACYTVIQGNATIKGNNITNLQPLQNIVKITGNLTINYNTMLTTLQGLNNLDTVGGSFFMYYNFQLANCCAIDTLLTSGGVVNSTVIFNNKSGSHCNSASAIMMACPLAPPITNFHDLPVFMEANPTNTTQTLTPYPNPANGQVTFDFNLTTGNATLHMRDLLGKTVFVLKLEEGTDRVTIDLDELQVVNGLYIVTLYENGGSRSVQLVVQR